LLALAWAPTAWSESEDSAVLSIVEWPVPWPNTRPRDPAVAADGRIWLVGQAGHYLAVFDPKSEQFTRFDLDDGTGPHNVIVTRDQEIWYAGNRAAHLGRLDPETGTIDKVATPEDRAQDPHTLIEDGQGRIWFTAQWGNHIGRYDRANSVLELAAVPTAKARPYGIVVADDGDAWVVLLGTNKLARVDGQSMELTEIELPREQARPRRIALSGGKVWYVDYDEGYLGAYDPEDQSFQEYRAPSERSGPYALGVDHHGRLWFVETWPEPNRLVGFDPETEAFFASEAIPSGAGAVRHMVFDPATRSFWFGTDTNNLARARIGD
jgi:virginiamycin B lyase